MTPRTLFAPPDLPPCSSRQLEERLAQSEKQRQQLVALAEQEKRARLELGTQLNTHRNSIETLQNVKADRPELQAVAEALHDIKGMLLMGGGGGAGGAAQAAETMKKVEAAQSQTRSQLLSLQSHVRGLLRKAERAGGGFEGGGENPIEAEALRQARQEWRAQLSGVEEEVNRLASSKADISHVDAALDDKVALLSPPRPPMGRGHLVPPTRTGPSYLPRPIVSPRLSLAPRLLDRASGGHVAAAA